MDEGTEFQVSFQNSLIIQLVNGSKRGTPSDTIILLHPALWLHESLGKEGTIEVVFTKIAGYLTAKSSGLSNDSFT